MKLWGNKKKDDDAGKIPTLVDGKVYRVQGYGKLVARLTDIPGQWSLNTLPESPNSTEKPVIRVQFLRLNTRLVNVETLELMILSSDRIDRL